MMVWQNGVIKYMDIKNHKGEQCPFKEILCQEGYCMGCQIFLNWCYTLKKEGDV